MGVCGARGTPHEHNTKARGVDIHLSTGMVLVPSVNQLKWRRKERRDCSFSHVCTTLWWRPYNLSVPHWLQTPKERRLRHQPRTSMVKETFCSSSTFVIVATIIPPNEEVWKEGTKEGAGKKQLGAWKRHSEAQGKTTDTSTHSRYHAYHAYAHAEHVWGLVSPSGQRCDQ